MRAVLNPEFVVDGSPVARIAKIESLDPLAEAIQPAIRNARDANPIVKGALSGTWLGHSLHPLLTDVPIGAFTMLTVLDTAECAGRRDMGAAADLTLGVAIVSAYAAIVTGWADWADTHDQPRRVGLAHALLNGTAMLAYQGSLALRRAGLRKAGIASSFVGYAFLVAGSYLGGELATGMHLGVRHTANPIAPPDDYADVAAVADVGDAALLRVEANGVPILLSRDESGVHAIGAVCSHRGAPLEEGSREGDCVRCPWHGALFDLRNGRPHEGPATFAVPTYAVRIAGDRIQVRAMT